MTTIINFPKRKQALLTGLQGQIEAIKQTPEDAEAYDKLYESLKAYRDFVRDFLERLPEGERRNQPLEINILEIHELAKKAYKEGVIEMTLAHGIGIMANYIAIVLTQSWCERE